MLNITNTAVTEGLEAGNLGMMRIAVILNPTADRGRAASKTRLISKGLERRGVSHEIFLTRRPGHATELARRTLEEGYSAVVAAGGDGTVNEVIQALVGTEIPLGVLPCGSGNDFIKAVGIREELEAALDIVAKGIKRPVDVGLVEFEGIGSRYFINCFGAGIDGKIALDYKNMRFLKGDIGYLWAAILELFRFRGFRVRIELEGEMIRGSLALLPFQNGPYAGGGFHVAPGARPDDGVMDLVVVEDRPIPQRIPLLKRFRDGTYLELSGIRRLEVREAWVEIDRGVPAHLDGEVIPEVRVFSVRVVPQGIWVISASPGGARAHPKE